MPGISFFFADAVVSGPEAGTVNSWIAFSLSVNLTRPCAPERDQPSGVLTVSPAPGTAYGT